MWQAEFLLLGAPGTFTKFDMGVSENVCVSTDPQYGPSARTGL